MRYSILTKALVPAIILGATPVLSQGCTTKDNQQFTFFGLGSAGTHTQFKCNGNTYVDDVSQSDRTRDDTGTYENPAIFAAGANDATFPKCSLIYIPLFKKYYRYNDNCEACSSDGHIDLWTGIGPEPSWDDTSIPADLKKEMGDCEGSFGTKSGTILLNPPSGLEVSTATLDDGKTCYNDASHVFESNTASCGGGGNPESPASSSTSSSPPLNTGQAQPPSSSSTTSAAPTTLAIGDYSKLKIVQNEALYQVNDQTSSSTTTSVPTDTATDTATAPTDTSGTGAPGDPCPEFGWFSGCVWGSGSGQIGATCQSKLDCFGDFICVGGKCSDNRTGAPDKLKRKHRRRHLDAGLAARFGTKH